MRFALPFFRTAHASFRLCLVLFAAVTTTLARPLMSHGTVAAQDLGIALGEQGPGGPLETLDGKVIDLAQYLGKEPVVLEFWATWCGNCKQLEPAMRAAATKYAGKVQFITVAVSINQSIERVRAWQKATPMPGLMLYDRKGIVSGAYDAPATSYVVVLDKTGKVVYTGAGGTQNVDAAIRKAL